jgi:hypothetical protein
MNLNLAYLQPGTLVTIKFCPENQCLEKPYEKSHKIDAFALPGLGQPALTFFLRLPRRLAEKSCLLALKRTFQQWSRRDELQ